jgi:hypothetical protein
MVYADNRNKGLTLALLQCSCMKFDRAISVSSNNGPAMNCCQSVFAGVREMHNMFLGFVICKQRDYRIAQPYPIADHEPSIWSISRAVQRHVAVAQLACHA